MRKSYAAGVTRFCAAMVLALAACGGGSSSSPPSKSSPPGWESRCPGSDVYVAYEVDGPSDVTMETPDGTRQETITAHKSWGYCFPASSSFVYVSAQNSGGGSIGCTITVDGRHVAANTSSGEYAIVTCSP